MDRCVTSTLGSGLEDHLEGGKAAGGHGGFEWSSHDEVACLLAILGDDETRQVCCAGVFNSEDFRTTALTDFHGAEALLGGSIDQLTASGLLDGDLGSDGDGRDHWRSNKCNSGKGEVESGFVVVVTREVDGSDFRSGGSGREGHGKSRGAICDGNG